MFVADQDWDWLLRGLILGPIALAWIVGLVRLFGLRTFSKMTSIDFVVTVASGSLLQSAAVASDWRHFGTPLVALGALIAGQRLDTFARMRWGAWARMVSNTPVELIRSGRIDRQALDRVRMSTDQLLSKLRQSGVHDIAEVGSMVMETTGDTSIVTGPRPDEQLMTPVRAAQPHSANGQHDRR